MARQALLSVGLTAMAVGWAPLALAGAGDGAIEVSGEASAVGGVSDGKAKGDFDAEVKVKGSHVLKTALRLAPSLAGALMVSGRRRCLPADAIRAF